MGVDYRAVGGVGLLLSKEEVLQMHEILCGDEEPEDLEFEVSDKLEYSWIERYGDSYSGDIEYMWLIAYKANLPTQIELEVAVQEIGALIPDRSIAVSDVKVVQGLHVY